MKTVNKNRPRGPITTAIRRIGESKLPEQRRKELGLWIGATWFDAVAMGMFRAAVNGNPEAAREIREVVVCKSPLRIELTGEGGGAIVIADLVKKNLRSCRVACLIPKNNGPAKMHVQGLREQNRAASPVSVRDPQTGPPSG